MSDTKEDRQALGTLLERVLRRLHDEWHAEMDERDGNHEATESDKERQAEADRAMKLLNTLYPDMKISVEHKPAEDFDGDDKEPDDKEE